MNTRLVPLATVILAALGLAPIGLQWLPSEDPLSAAAKVVVAALAVGMAPGAVLVLLWRPKPLISAFELVGLGVAMSLGLVHLLAMLALVAHLPAREILIGLCSTTTAAAVWMGWRGTPSVEIRVRREELILGGLLILLGVALYLRGSPVVSFEDQVHVSIVRRLAEIEAPTISNFYFAPNVVYTYPFPGVHYLMALVSRAGAIDALFVYDKLRCFWGPSAIVMLFLAARAVFGTRGAATTVALTAIALASSGVSAEVPKTFWAQLVPSSHPSDVAMGVVLPALLVAAFGYVQGESHRERSFMLALSLLLVSTLAVIHIREIIQFLTYLGAFILALSLLRSHRVYVRRAAVLGGLTLAVTLAYLTWHSASVPQVTDLVRTQRDKLVGVAASSSLAQLLFTAPHELLGDFFFSVEPLFEGLTPFILFAGPLVIVAFRHRPLIWFVASGTLAYLLLLSIPALAIPYIYLTYYEVFFTPVRYLVFFVYLMAGAFVYLCVTAAARLPAVWTIAAAAGGAALGLIALITPLWLNQNHAALFVPLVGAYALTWLLLPRAASGHRAGRRRLTTAIGALVAGVALAGLGAMSPFGRLYPEQPPPYVNVRWTEGLSVEARGALERRFSLTDGEPMPDEKVNVWTYGLRDVSAGNIEQLVRHPDVADTHHIDRAGFHILANPQTVDNPILGFQYIPRLQYPGVAAFGATAFALWILAFALPHALARRGPEREAVRGGVSGQVSWLRYSTALCLFILTFVPWTARPTLSAPMTAFSRPEAVSVTPNGLVARMACVTRERMAMPFTEEVLGEPLLIERVTACPMDPALATWIRMHVSANAVFAINRWNEHLPTVLIPQQVVAFPGFERAFADERVLFRGYYRLYDRRIATYRAQPFFNAVESLEERAEFVKALGVTHVLIDPAYYESMTRVLDRHPDRFVLRHAQGQWAVYEVRPMAPG